jgi:type I restriction enzyme R subunit
MKKHTEARLEDAIVDSLTRQGGFVFVDYRSGPAVGRFDKALALDPSLVLGFIQATQPKVWQSLLGHGPHGGQRGNLWQADGGW